MPAETGGLWAGRALRTVADVVRVARDLKLTKSQHVMFLLADMMTWAEVSGALCEKAARSQNGTKWSRDFLLAVSRLFARETVELVHANAQKILRGGEATADSAADEIMANLPVASCQAGMLRDMDLVAAELTK